MSISDRLGLDGACCLIEKDTEADEYGAEYQFHCLIIEDTVANVRRNE